MATENLPVVVYPDHALYPVLLLAAQTRDHKNTDYIRVRDAYWLIEQNGQFGYVFYRKDEVPAGQAAFVAVAPEASAVPQLSDDHAGINFEEFDVSHPELKELPTLELPELKLADLPSEETTAPKKGRFIK